MGIQANGQKGMRTNGHTGKWANGQKGKRAKGQKDKGNIQNVNHRGKLGKVLLSEIRRI